MTTRPARVWMARNDAQDTKDDLYAVLNPVLDTVHPISQATEIERKLTSALAAAYEAGHEAGIHQAVTSIRGGMIMTDPTWQGEPPIDYWEPDEWDTINANEADDYRHENDEYDADHEEYDDGE